MHLVPKTDPAEIVRLYREEGLSINKLAKIYGVSRQAIDGRIKMYEKRMAAGKLDKRVEMELMKKMFAEQGKTIGEIAEEFGMTVPGVRYRLRVAGLVPPAEKRPPATKPQKPKSRKRKARAGKSDS